ncbi:uncharacterized protein SPAPADRAFT_151473 [Spathaspora passalidarum NRRL Y-27907]|uniref:S-adenosylmethionine-dependent methyltransferase n=1 Tax=Spathaspora passalidarum (strain NRRL Y-27907 / 11-Y1) TaxID=619300 RepID=G3AMB3_SPAPN|nr:uncharacterized protein SPAPADRAFT_151473 [Spathaspora passalidarum NRRL Y-27907]EGW33410.1 hypothetical protein SPAPADRAFT_151473 [Spathaspora passalidarum NRRL Y-27907]
MDFDPLSLFTPPPAVEEEHEQVSLTSKASVGPDAKPISPDSIPHDDDDDDDYSLPLHPLDLPLLKLQPPFEVLITILKLFAPNEVFNFNVEEPSDIEFIDPNTVFTEKSIDESTISIALSWLATYTPRFNTIKKLAYIPTLADSFKKTYSNEFNAYFTRLISSPLLWITDPSQIHKLAALRISENCGRTAQPEIIRKIRLPNLDKLLGNVNNGYILLKEPSLTSDNLGLKTWGSSLVLANRLLNNNDGYLTNKVLELGAGTGLVGMICSLLGYETLLTDLPEIVPNLQENIQLNEIKSDACALDWTDPSSFIEKYGNTKFDTIVVSDPIYSPQHPYWVVNMINQFLSASPDARVVIQIPLRAQYEQERQTLWDLLESSNFTQLQHEIEDGFDDFGEMKFCFKLYSR